MKITKVYKYRRKSGGITISTHKPICEYEELSRLIADESKLLANGKVNTACVDVESADGWSEIDAPPEPIFAT